LFFAFFAPFSLAAFVIPPAVLDLLVIWALPQVRTAPTKPIYGLLLAFIVGLIAWPNYLALALPRLPWITVARLTGVPLVLLLLICLSVSKEFRSTIGRALNSTPLLWKFVVGFAIVEGLRVFLSETPIASLNHFIVDQMNWTAIFVVSVYVFLKPGRVEQSARLLWVRALFVYVIGLIEFRHGRVPWAGHVPIFLKIDDPAVTRTLAGTRRSADGIYRVESTFPSSLGLSEYLALVMPSVLHFAFGSDKRWMKFAALLSIPFVLFVVLITGSRLGMVGYLVSFTLYGLVWVGRSALAAAQEGPDRASDSVHLSRPVFVGRRRYLYQPPTARAGVGQWTATIQRRRPRGAVGHGYPQNPEPPPGPRGRNKRRCAWLLHHHGL